MVGRREFERAGGKIPVMLLPGLLIVCLMLTDCGEGVNKSCLPEPVLTDDAGWLDLYRKSWMLIDQLEKRGNDDNDFPEKYLNPDDRDVIDQWSVLSTALFAMYGYTRYPVMETLDLFYRKQRGDGFIARSYITQSGEPLHLPSQADPMIHPPLFAWVELRYFYLSGDTLRLRRVFPVLEKYFHWIDRNCRGKYAAAELYYSNQIASGMLNLPRGNIEFGGWIDLSAQMALFAEQLRQIADILKDSKKTAYYQRKYRDIAAAIQAKLWNPDSTFYFDMTREGEPSRIYNIAGFWPLLAGIPSHSRAMRLIDHLKDYSAFHLEHMFPSVSIRAPEYNPLGFYWRGGVWGVTNYMIIAGLQRYGEQDFAREAARNHLNNMQKVYQGFDIKIDIDSVYFDETLRYRIWEMYAPEEAAPGTRWDAKNYCRKDHICFSGHGPISMLIEDILGFSVNAPADRLDWNIRRKDRHGIRRLHFGDNCVSVWTEPQPENPDVLVINGSTDSEVSIDFRTGNEEFLVHFDPGPIGVGFIPENYIIRNRFSR
ncbi:MAG: MGH1-like glycoside hydrolase domain-containing protein [Fidelibacterota bacterium]